MLYPELPHLDHHLAHHAPTMADCIQLSKNVQCYLHQKPIFELCRASKCPQRLLCGACKEQHAIKHKDHMKFLSPIKDLLEADNPFIRELDMLSQEEDTARGLCDPRFKYVSNSITSAFLELKIRGEELLNQAEERAQFKAKEYFLLRKNTTEWASLRNEYLTFRNKYLSFFGTENNGLDDLVNVINKITEKQEQREAEIEVSLKLGREQMDKFLQRFKENVAILTDSLFQPQDNSSQNPSIIIDATKISYDGDMRGSHKMLLNAMTYIPKLDQLVTASECGSLTTWNPSTYAPISTLKIHNDSINCLLYVEKESLLLTGAKDKSIRVVPVEAVDGINIKKVEVFSSHTAPVKSLLLLEGEDRIASAGEDADLRIWHMKSRNLETIISTKGWKTSGDEMAWIRPERWIAVAGKGEIRIYNYVTRELIMTQETWKRTGSLAFLNERRMLIARNKINQITMWRLDSAKKRLKKEMKLDLESKNEETVYFKCFEENDLLITSTGTQKVIAFDLKNGKMLKEISTKLQSPSCFTLLKSERKLAVGDAESGQIGFLQY